MSRTGMRHIANPYGGLSFAQGPQTFSTSPFWDASTRSLYPQSYSPALPAVGHGFSYLAGPGETGNGNGKKNGNGNGNGWTNMTILGYSLPVAAIIAVVGYYVVWPMIKKKPNPRKRRRNTRRRRTNRGRYAKKGQRRAGTRRGARLAYDALPKRRKRKNTRRRRNSAYNNFVGREMRAGKSMKQAAAAWRRR